MIGCDSFFHDWWLKKQKEQVKLKVKYDPSILIIPSEQSPDYNEMTGIIIMIIPRSVYCS